MSRRSTDSSVTVSPANEVEAPTICSSSSDQSVLQLTDRLATVLQTNPTVRTRPSALHALRLRLEQLERGSISVPAINRAPAATTMPVSKPPVFFCSIHQELHPVDVVIRIKGCAHAFCRDGLKEYIGSKLKDRQVPGLCPKCIPVARGAAEGKVLGSASNVPTAFHLITEFSPQASRTIKPRKLGLTVQIINSGLTWKWRMYVKRLSVQCTSLLPVFGPSECFVIVILMVHLKVWYLLLC
jgi:hypothetical protein